MTKRKSTARQYLASLPFIRHFTPHLGIFCLVMGVSVFSNGFDLSIYNSIQAMSAFQQTFGDQCNPETGVCTIGTAHLSMLNSFPLITYAIAIFTAAVLGEAFGRRVVYIIMTCVCFIGVGVTYSSKTYAQIVIGRMIVHFYCGMESWLIPLFTAEVVPAKLRGSLVSFYLLGRMIGSLTIGIVCWRTSGWAGDPSWTTPITVLFAPPALALMLSWVLPESPRWLLRKGKDDQALKSLRWLRDGDGSNLEHEMFLLKEALALDTKSNSWADLFRGTNARRTGIAMTMNFIGLATGQAFANIYGTIFLKSLHTVDPFLFTVVSQCCSIAGAILFVTTVDQIGRRPLLLVCGTLASGAMIAIGALGTGHPSIARKNGIVAMIPVFGFFFLSSFASIASLTAAEIPSLKLRDKTAAMGWTIQNLTNFVATFTVPYLMNPGYGNLNAKVGYIYGSIGLAALVWSYFFFPELKGRSLEEIDEMLRQKVPARKTGGWKFTAGSIGAQITGIETRAHLKHAHSKENVIEVERANDLES